MKNTGLLAKALVEVKNLIPQEWSGSAIAPNCTECSLLEKAGATAVMLGIFDEALCDSRFTYVSLKQLN